MESGKDTSNSISRSPRCSGFFGNGSPYPIILLLIPGFTMSLIDIGMFLPSIVGTLTEQPHNAYSGINKMQLKKKNPNWTP